MSTITADQVRHIAKLARLSVSEGDLEKYAGELSAILNYVDVLTKVDTSGVEPTAQVTGLTNVTRSDVVRDPPLANGEALVQCSGLRIVENQIETPSAHG